MNDLRRNPFVGLRPFFIDDSLYFFGREEQTSELLEILHRHRFLGIVGSSGSGKSSLIRAGLIPALLGGFLMEDRDRWHIVQMKPGDSPIGNLATSLLEATGETATPEARLELEQKIRDEHTDAVIEFLNSRLDKDANLFLLVDQFEEIFAFRGTEGDDRQKDDDQRHRQQRANRKAEAADFVDLIMALANRRELPLFVALTMRTDFLGDCDLFYGLPEALNRGRYLVPRMTRQQLGRAISGPAMLMRARVAPRLLDHLLNELGDRFDRLPVLQHALLRTWDAWQQDGGAGPLDLRHYRAAGGLDGALDQDAENALEGLDIDVTRRVFKRLTDTDLAQRRVRSPARISELEAATGADRSVIEQIVKRFTEGGRNFLFTSTDGEPDDPRVDISHESLIRQWHRLREWVDEERERRDKYRELVVQARKYEIGEALLLQGPELEAAREWRQRACRMPGWAARYATADGDFDSTKSYVDQSMMARCQNLAEAELKRRWKRVWHPLILVAVLAGGFWPIMGALESAEIALDQVREQDIEQAVRRSGTQEGRGDTRPAPPVEGSASNEQTASSSEILRPALLKLGILLAALGAAYFLLVAAGRRVHRRMALPAILEHFVATDGRDPNEAEPVERPDGLDVRSTFYASAARRIGGYWIDGLLYAAVVGVLLLIANSGADYATVIFPDGTEIEGIVGPEGIDEDGASYIDLSLDDGVVRRIELSYVEILSTWVRGPSLAGPEIEGEYASYRFLPDGTEVIDVVLQDGRLDSVLAASAEYTDIIEITLPGGERIEGTSAGWGVNDNGANYEDVLLDDGTMRTVELTTLFYQPRITTAESRSILVFWVVFAWLYSALQLSSRHQATLGMRALGLLRTDLTGARLSFVRASVWWLSRLLSYLTVIGFMIQPIMKKRQTFHDWLSHTVVHQRRPAKQNRTFRVVGGIGVAILFVVTLYFVIFLLALFAGNFSDQLFAIGSDQLPESAVEG